jgi:hypothetical protein
MQRIVFKLWPHMKLLPLRNRLARKGVLPRLIWVAALNSALLVLYLWAWRDEVLHVKIIVNGDQHIVSLGSGEDEKVLNECRFQQSPTGRIGILFAPSDCVWPELYCEQAIDNVVVREYPSGKILFEDDFSSPDINQWNVRSGSFVVNDRGQLTTVNNRPLIQQGGHIEAGDYRWKDYTLEADLIDSHKFFIFVRVAPDGSGDRLNICPQHWGFVWEGAPGGSVLLHVGIPRYIRLMARNVLENYGWAVRLSLFFAFSWFLCLGVCWCIGFFLRIRAVGVIAGSALFTSIGRLPWMRVLSGVCLGILLAGVFAVSYYISDVIHERIPHVQDSVSMLFQARILAGGHTWVPSPDPAFLDFFKHQYVTMNKYGNGKCFSKYLPANSAVLAIGILFGVPWLIPPIVGAAACFFIYLSAREIYSRGVGLVAVALAFCSPFYMILVGSYMSHITALFFGAGAVFFFQRMLRRREARWAFLTGLFLGACGATRPMSAITLGFGLGLFALMQWILWRHELPGAGRPWGKIVFGLLGIGIMLFLTGCYNYSTTGSFLVTPVTFSDPHDTIGFGTRGLQYHTIGMGVRNIWISFVQLLPELFGWPPYITLSFFLVPFLLASRNRWDYFWLALIIITNLGYSTYATFPNNIFGARYMYETLPFIFLLSARGVVMIARIPEEIYQWWISARAKDSPISRSAKYFHSASAVNMVIVVAFVALLVQNNFQNTNRWPVLKYFNLEKLGDDLKNYPPGQLLSSWSRHFGDFYQKYLADHRGYNYCDARILKMVKKRNIHNALVFVKPFERWTAYGSVFPQNTPYFNGDIVYAQSVGHERDLELVRMYPGRRYFYADYHKNTLNEMDIPGDLFLSPAPADSIYAKPVQLKSKVKRKPVAGPSPEEIYAGIAEGEFIFLEGEDFPNGGYEHEDQCGWKYGNNTPGYSGKGHLVSGGAGCPTKMFFEVPQGGAYSVWIRHCCQEGGEGRLHIDSWQHDFGEEEISGTFKWAKLGEGKLGKGKHTISIEDLGPGWTVIDSILLARGGNSIWEEPGKE